MRKLLVLLEYYIKNLDLLLLLLSLFESNIHDALTVGLMAAELAIPCSQHIPGAVALTLTGFRITGCAFKD
jgi:hypothetical protein